jgi:hypothetical protein
MNILDLQGLNVDAETQGCNVCLSWTSSSDRG